MIDLLFYVAPLCASKPEHLMHEIIFLDDYSDHPGNGLEEEKTNKYGHVYPAQMLADVLTFTDSHVECNEQRLKRLLTRVREDPTRVIFPIIDVISMGQHAGMPPPKQRVKAGDLFVTNKANLDGRVKMVPCSCIDHIFL
uniref:Uncharacterized protein n=1 Tax=Glossina pallidipes TaxID=7398 RepID=A0A1A9Z4E1_GLOPL